MTFTILLVGSGDIGRGALATDLIVRELHRIWPRSADEVVAVSAGLDAVDGTPLPAHVETVARRRGLDLGDHRATAMSPALAERADLVLTMTRTQRARIVLQYPSLRSRTFALLEFLALLTDATEARRRQPMGRGDRLEARLRLVVAAVAARQRSRPAPADDRQWDVFDPYAYSLDIYETVATTLEHAAHALVADVAVLTGTRGSSSASRTA
jgi:protein-tyrosine phosphatase